MQRFHNLPACRIYAQSSRLNDARNMCNASTPSLLCILPRQSTADALWATRPRQLPRRTAKMLCEISHKSWMMLRHWPTARDLLSCAKASDWDIWSPWDLSRLLCDQDHAKALQSMSWLEFNSASSNFLCKAAPEPQSGELPVFLFTFESMLAQPGACHM